jgi:hypothetical protein
MTEQERQDYLTALRDTLATPAGRHVLQHVLRSCGVFDPDAAFVPDPMVLSRNEGRRSWGLEIMNDMAEAAPASLGTILEEVCHG